jgi:DNA-directed RNA polymerase specialized sigma subunit
MIIYSRRQKLKITKDRKKQVIDLYFNQHKSYAEIAQIEKMSPRDIHAIIKEEEADDKNIKIKSYPPKPTNCFLKVRQL